MVYRKSIFNRFANKSAHAMGNPIAFMLAMIIVVAWGITGPWYKFSDTWQLVINTGTTVITFLMVFLIQNTQNRDSATIQIKLDELIRAVEGAHNALLNLEDLEDEELDLIRARYTKLAEKARKEIDQGRRDTGRPEISPNDK